MNSYAVQLRVIGELDYDNIEGVQIIGESTPDMTAQEWKILATLILEKIDSANKIELEGESNE